jgi:transcriptional regulator with XRE-family HTH domain
MDFTSLLTDDAVLAELGARLRRRRVDLALTQSELAHQAGIAKRTVERLEDGSSVQTSRLVRVLRALDLMAGLGTLVAPVRARPMEHLRREGKPRQRGSSTPRREQPEEPWTWGDEQ